MASNTWIQVSLNGALTDSLVESFDGATSKLANQSPDLEICFYGYYQAAATLAVNLFLAPAAAAALENVVPIRNSASLSSGTVQTFSFSTNVPLQAAPTNTPLACRITKPVGNASLWYKWRIVVPGTTG